MGRETTQRSKTSAGDRKKPHEEFAEQIMIMIGQGVAPWQKAWKAGEYYAPFNPVSGTVYRGVNRLMLTRPDMADPRWMTFKHAQKTHYRVKAGSKSTPVEFWQWTKEVDRRDDNGRIIYGPDGKPEKEVVKLDRPRIYISNVFHAAQIETEDREPIPAFSPPPLEWNPHEKAEAILHNSGASIHNDQRDKAYYSPSSDEIHLPYRENFSAAGDYYCTALHELGHWACSKRRLNMEGGAFGTESYGQEELRVEIASWMICQDLGLDFQPESSAAYVQHWMKSIREDPYEIVRACRDAEKIKGYVLSLERGLDKDEPFIFAGLESTPAFAEMPVFRTMENGEPASPDKWFFGLERPVGFETSLEYAGLTSDSDQEMKDQLAAAYDFHVQVVFRAAADVWPEYLPLEMRRRVLSERLLEALALHGKMVEIGALPPEARFRHQEMAEAIISRDADGRDRDLWLRNLENPGDFQFQYPQFASMSGEAGPDEKDRLAGAYRAALNQVSNCLDDQASGQADLNARRLVLASALMDMDALHHLMVKCDLMPPEKRVPYLERTALLTGAAVLANGPDDELPEPRLILENQVNPASYQFLYPHYASVNKDSSREDQYTLLRAYSTALEQVSLCGNDHRVGELDIQTRRSVMASALLDLNILHNQVNALKLTAENAPLIYHDLADVLPEHGEELPHTPAERLNLIIERSAAKCAVASDFDAMKLALLTTAHVTRQAMESPDFEAPGAGAESKLLSLINFEAERLDTARDTEAIVETFLHNVVTFANIQGNRVDSGNLGLYRQALQTYVDGYELGSSELELLTGESVSFKHDFDGGRHEWRLDAITHDILCRENPDSPWREPTKEEFEMLMEVGDLKLTPTIALGGDRFLTYDGHEHGRVQEHGQSSSADSEKLGFVRVYEDKNSNSPDEPSRYLMYAFDRSGQPFHAVMINHDLPPNAVRQIFVSMKLYADAAAKGRDASVLDEIMERRAVRTWRGNDVAEAVSVIERSDQDRYLVLDENGLKPQTISAMGRNWFIKENLDQPPDKFGSLNDRKQAAFAELKRLAARLQSKDRPRDAKDQLHFTALDSREIDLKDKPYTEMIEKVIGAMWDENISGYARNVKAALTSYESDLGAGKDGAEKYRVQAADPEPWYSEEAVYLKVPFKEKNQAKAAGAKWDDRAKLWYAPIGTDLSGLTAWMYGRQPEPAPSVFPEDEFLKAMMEAGLRPNGPLVLDGNIHRVPVEGAKSGTRDGAYQGHADGVPNGWAINHKTGQHVKWVANGHTLSEEQTVLLKAEVESRKRQIKADREKGYSEAAGRAFDKLFAPGVVSAPQDHPYLQAKGVYSYGLHQDAAGNLLIEGLDISSYHCVGRGPEPPQGPEDLTPHRQVQTLQTISPGGKKTYEPGTKKTGAAFLIGEKYLKEIAFDQWRDRKNSEPLLAGLDLEPRREILVAEGYATGATLFKATGLPVAVAFDAGNLKLVAEALKKQFPSAEIVVCADNDHANKVNVGLEKAQAAAEAVGGRVVIPEFTDEEKARGLTDFNDLAQSRGTFAVTKLVSSKYRERLKPEILDLTVNDGLSR